MKERGEKRKPVIDNVFPVSHKAATDAAKAITFLGGDKSFAKHFLVMVKSIRDENKEVVDLFFTQLALYDALSNRRDPGREADIWLGAAYAYEALRREAQERGVLE